MQNDILKGFQIGADDYITKPFSMDVLLARINALINRTKVVSKEPEKQTKLGKLIFDFSRQTISDGTTTIKMTARSSIVEIIIGK